MVFGDKVAKKCDNNPVDFLHALVPEEFLKLPKGLAPMEQQSLIEELPLIILHHPRSCTGWME